MNEPHFGILWKDGSLTDLDFADDIAMLSTSLQHLQEMTTKLQEIAAKIGLRINCPKTKIMHSLQSTNQTITIENEPLEQVQHFQYLGSYISIDGTNNEDIKKQNWQSYVHFSENAENMELKVDQFEPKTKIIQHNGPSDYFICQ